MKSERLHLVLPAWLKKAIKDCSDERGVSMSEFIKDVLKDAVKRENKPKVDDN